MTKKTLRSESRRALEKLSESFRAQASFDICRRIARLRDWEKAGTVGLYSAQPFEPHLDELFKAGEKKIALPRVAGDALEFHLCASETLLRPGPWGLLEPHPEDCPVVGPEEIDLLCIPGLAFTRAGGRLGRGGGFYDRFLKRTHPRAVKLGICFEAQLIETLPIESHDHEVDCVVTEAGIWRSSKAS